MQALNEEDCARVLAAQNRRDVLANSIALALGRGSPRASCDAHAQLGRLPPLAWAFLVSNRGVSQAANVSPKQKAETVRQALQLARHLARASAGDSGQKAAVDLIWLVNALAIWFTDLAAAQALEDSATRESAVAEGAQSLLALCQAEEALELGVPPELVLSMLFLKLFGACPTRPRDHAELKY